LCNIALTDGFRRSHTRRAPASQIQQETHDALQNL